MRSSLERYVREARAAQVILDRLLTNNRERSEEQVALVSDFIALLSNEVDEAHRIAGIVRDVKESARLEEAGIQPSVPPINSSVLGARSTIANALSEAISFANPDLIMVDDGHASAVAVEAAQRMIDASTE